MNYGSLCSGIEAASVAWKPLGWRCQFVAEIDKQASAVLAYHYADTPNLGDMTKFEDWPDHAIDVLVGGTPCQSFSVAGLRRGLDDPRGSLMLGYGAVARRYRPRWLVWENVPGVLSSNGGRDFGTFLGMLGELGYGFAYRVLDAQHFGVPQRRRRVFVVGHLGDWRRAAAVLFERHSLSGNPPPRRKTGEGIAPTISARTSGGGGLGADFDCDGGLVSHTLNARGGSGRIDAESGTFVTHSHRADGFDASEDGTGRGTPLVAEPYTLAIRGREGGHHLEYRQDGTANAILTPNGGRAGIGVGAIAIQAGALRENPESGPDGVGVRDDGFAFTLEARAEVQAVAYQTSGNAGAWETGDATGALTTGGAAVRRLTVEECEALQGFPRGYTLIPYRGKPMADGPRYKMLGNSFAVPVVAWLGRRIALVDATHPHQERADG